MVMITSKSKVSKASPNSVRAVIPKNIAELLDIDLGDSLKWVADISAEGVTITVEKLEE